MKKFFQHIYRLKWTSVAAGFFGVGVAVLLTEMEQATADSFVISYAQPELRDVVRQEITQQQELSELEMFATINDPAVLQFLAEYIVQTQTKDWPRGYRGEFLYDIAVPALLSAHKNKIPPSVVMGQAIFESGWGRSRLAKQYNNLFGIKGTGSGTTAVKTFERNSRNHRYRKWARFKVFANRGEAIAYHGDLLATDRRYKKARAKRENWREFMQEASRYYASDPNYAKKMATIVEYYQLDRWDSVIMSLQEQDSYSASMIAEPSTLVAKK